MRRRVNLDGGDDFVNHMMQQQQPDGSDGLCPLFFSISRFFSPFFILFSVFFPDETPDFSNLPPEEYEGVGKKKLAKLQAKAEKKAAREAVRCISFDLP